MEADAEWSHKVVLMHYLTKTLWQIKVFAWLGKSSQEAKKLGGIKAKQKKKPDK